MSLVEKLVNQISAAVAAKALYVRRFIGFDIDETYLKVAAKNTGATVRAVA